jgi:hypothetical protein
MYVTEITEFKSIGTKKRIKTVGTPQKRRDRFEYLPICLDDVIEIGLK